MLVIGLTGGIGSGKTTVAKLFAEHNVPIIDADLIARELVEPGKPALEQLTACFSSDILKYDGSLDRRKLRERVFGDPEERKKLEEILHPLIVDGMIERLDYVEGAYVVLVIPLLVDTGNWSMIDRILVVDVDSEQQIQRVMQRDGVDRKHAEAIIDSQISRNDRIEAADDVIDNTNDIEILRDQVDLLHKNYLMEAYNDQAATTNTNNKKAQKTVCYEHPLNERVRTFLRLEQLFGRANYHLQNNQEADAHCLITVLVDINNLLSRGDIKSEIIKELERQQNILKQHADAPAVDQKLLKNLLKNQNESIKAVHAMEGKLSQHLQNDLLYNSVRQRLSLPGGSCEFDLPVFNYWLRNGDEKRAQLLSKWLEPYKALQDAIQVCMICIRQSSDPIELVANKGFYEETLDQKIEPQLVRVFADAKQPYYPTVSASKHRLNVRFLQWLPNDSRSPQANVDIPFSLMVCGI